jgi:serine/threonine protein kinase
MTLAAGSRLGAYEILAPLGAGGMGEVWRARDTKLGREVALKVLPQSLAQDAERLARFEREAQLLATLNHPHIASIYGVEDSTPTKALVLELVEGETLQERIARGPLALADALAIARQIGEALEAAHEKGVIHRDLKPANVKLTAEDAVKVLDFGLAKALDPAASQEPSASPTLMNSPTLTAAGTQLGVILGTAAYMAPEQARGGAVDARADVWAFGVVLYEMLTGAQPFLADTVPDTLARVLTREIDPASLPPGIPEPVRSLVMRCLVRQPKNRLHAIADARLVLDEALEKRAPQTASAATAGSGWRRALPWLGGILVGAALGFVAASRLPSRDASSSSAVTPRIRTLVSVGQSGEPSLSPDGNSLAFTSVRDGLPRVWIKDLKSGSESVLGPPKSWEPRFSPDGTSVLYGTEEGPTHDLYRISLTTRERRLVARNAGMGAWSPKGRSVVFLRRPQTGSTTTEVVVCDLESGKEQIVHREETFGLAAPQYSPDGERLAIGVGGGQAGAGDRLRILDLASGRPEDHPLLLPDMAVFRAQGMAWVSPTRLALMLVDTGSFINQAGRIAVYDVDRRRLTSLVPLPVVGFGLAVAGPQSVIVGVESAEQSLIELRRAAGESWSAPSPRTEGPFHDRQPVYSPDGRWIVFSSDRSGNLDLWRISLVDGELQRLTDDPAEDWDPGLSADGTRLLFSSNRTGRFQIWMAEADGSSPRQVTDVENAQNPTMTADGHWIVYTRQDAGDEKNGIWKVQPDGSGEARLVAGLFFHPETSPDGRYVAFQLPSGRELRIGRIADGKLLSVSLPRSDRYRWTVAGGATQLWAITTQEDVGSIVRLPFDAKNERLGPPTVVFTGDPNHFPESLGVAHDGSAVTYSQVANSRASLLRIDGLAGLERR